MMKQDCSVERERLVAEAVAEFAAELRLVDLADYVAFVRLELFGNIADLIASAAELYFFPGALSFGHGADAHVGWSGAPRVVLDMKFRNAGVTVYFRLILRDAEADIDVTYVAFDDPAVNPAENTATLAAALAGSRLKTAAAAGAEGWPLAAE